MLDLRGREIRMTHTKDNAPLIFKMGDVATISVDDPYRTSTNRCLVLDCPDLTRILRANDTIYFDQGKTIVQVKEIEGDELTIMFKTDGELYPGCPVKISGNRYEFMPLFRSEDLIDIREIAVKYNFDYLSIPSCTSIKDIQETRLLLKEQKI